MKFAPTLMTLVAAFLVGCEPPEYTLEDQWSGYWRQDGAWCPTRAFAGDGNRSAECRAAFGILIPNLLEPVVLAKVRFDIRRYVGPSSEQCDELLASSDRALYEAQCRECVDLVALDDRQSAGELIFGLDSVAAFEDAGDGARFGRFCATPEDEGGTIERLLTPAAIAAINEAGAATALVDRVFAFGIVPTTLDEAIADEGILFEDAGANQLEIWIKQARPSPPGGDSARDPQIRNAWLDLIPRR